MGVKMRFTVSAPLALVLLVCALQWHGAAAGPALHGFVASLKSEAAAPTVADEQVVSPLPSVYAAGSPFQVGHAVGATYEKLIKGYMADASMWKDLLAYYHTPAGADVFAAFRATNCKAYPDICEELRGVAEGAGLPFEHILLLNLQEDMKAHTTTADNTDPERLSSKGCTDVHVHSAAGVFLGHNEDADDELRNRTYVLQGHYRPPSGGLRGASGAEEDVRGTSEDFRGTSEDVRITSFHYAGVLPNAFGFNSHGIVMSINTLYPGKRVAGGLATWFITRDVLNANSLDDAVRRASVPGAANGFSLNVGSTKEKRTMNVEVYQAGVTTHEVTRSEGFFVHTNVYTHSPEAERTQEVGPSSVHRLKRISAMVQAGQVPKCPGSILRILGDTTDKEFPLYRHATKTDGSTTLATALFDLEGRTLTVYTANPTLPPLDTPVAVFNI